MVDQIVPSVVTISANGAGGTGAGSGHVLFADGKTGAATITGPQANLAVLKVHPPSGAKAKATVNLGTRR